MSLAANPDDWSDFFAALQTAEIPDDFLSDAQRTHNDEPDRDPFIDWLE